MLCQRLTPKRIGFVLALFYHRDLPASHSLATVPAPLFSSPTLHAPRLMPHAPTAGSGRARTLPRWLMHDTNHRIDKDRMGPDLDERHPSFSMSPNRAIAPEKSRHLGHLQRSRHALESRDHARKGVGSNGGTP